MLKAATELDSRSPPTPIVDIGQAKSLPKDKVVIVSTGSQGETCRLSATAWPSPPTNTWTSSLETGSSSPALPQIPN